MEIKDALSFLFQRADATQILWNLYLAVATAVIGIVTSGKKEWFKREVAVALTIVFAVFALSNLDSLDLVRQQRADLVAVATNAQGYQAEIHLPVIHSVRPPSRPVLIGYHATLDLFVLAAIWYVPIYRNRRTGK